MAMPWRVVMGAGVLFCGQVAFADSGCNRELPLIGTKAVGALSLYSIGAEQTAQACVLPVYAHPSDHANARMVECAALRTADGNEVGEFSIFPVLESRGAFHAVPLKDGRRVWANAGAQNAALSLEGMYPADQIFMRPSHDASAPPSLTEATTQREVRAMFESAGVPNERIARLLAGQKEDQGEEDPIYAGFIYIPVGVEGAGNGTQWLKAQEHFAWDVLGEWQPAKRYQRYDDATARYWTGVLREVFIPLREGNGTLLNMPESGPYCD